MSINMLCEFKNCGNGRAREARLKCLVCLKSSLFCEEHGLAHQKSVHKKMMYLDEEFISELFAGGKKLKLKDCINRILKDCNEIVSWIERLASEKIKELKDLNESIRNIGEFKILSLIIKN